MPVMLVVAAILWQVELGAIFLRVIGAYCMTVYGALDLSRIFSKDVTPSEPFAGFLWGLGGGYVGYGFGVLGIVIGAGTGLITFLVLSRLSRTRPPAQST
jgi:hypothetical protein